jgi:hypothetical protein
MRCVLPDNPVVEIGPEIDVSVNPENLPTDARLDPFINLPAGLSGDVLLLNTVWCF